MARLAGITLPNKQVQIVLTYIYGIGPSKAQKILESVKIEPTSKIDELTDEELNLLREVVEKQHDVEGALRQKVGLHIKRLKEINSYRGLRHKFGLPVHGQRTKTNARTKRGKRSTSGSGKISAQKK